MIPQATPAYVCSTCCASAAASSPDRSVPSTASTAITVATSSAADEESPAPSGTFPQTTPSTPRRAERARCASMIAPATYFAQDGMGAGRGSPREKANASSKLSA